MTIAEIQKIYVDELSTLYDREEAISLCYYAINHVSQLSKSEIIVKKNLELSLKEETSLSMILEELKIGKPIQYIIGETHFYGLRFKVNPSVLVPRQETEELVDWILKTVRGQSEEGKKTFQILDIGTGSGCIPIALKKHLPESNIFGIDISDSALETALNNAVINETEIKFIEDDILRPKFNDPPSTFDVIVSNPPYITVKEQEQMHQNVLKYEPYSALFVPDSDPLLFYKAIADFAFFYLKEGGFLFFEINERFGKEVVELLTRKDFKNIELRKDLMGKDRMIMAKK